MSFFHSRDIMKDEPIAPHILKQIIEKKDSKQKQSKPVNIVVSKQNKAEKCLF
jgi:hypothetical protein